MAYDPRDPKENIFAYGGNTIDVQTGITTPVNSTIGSASLTPAAPINYSTPTQTPVPNVAGLETNYATPPAVATPQETKATDLTSRLQALYDSQVGKSAFQTEQNKVAGVDTLQKTQQDLATQINQLKNEALAIPQQLQVEATGRGITAGGLAPLQTARLRTNAIAALGVSSLLDATNGLLASAQRKADQAVAAKYDPIQEQINAATKNLELILKDPAYTLAEKNRAQAQLDIQNRKKEELDERKAEDLAIRNVAIKAAGNNADVSTLKRISEAKTQIEALQIAAEKGLLIDTPASAEEYNFAVSHGYEGTYSQYQNEDANRKALVARAAVNGLPYQVTTQVDKLANSFDTSPIVKQYNEVANKTATISAIVGSGINGGVDDLALVFEFMKSLDPTSVVRESEYDTASKAGNPFKRIAAKMGGYISRGQILPQEVRDDFARLSNVKLNVVTDQYENLRNETARKINIKTGASDGVEYLTNYQVSQTQDSLDELPPIDGQDDNQGFFDNLLNLYK